MSVGSQSSAAKWQSHVLFFITSSCFPLSKIKEIQHILTLLNKYTTGYMNLTHCKLIFHNTHFGRLGSILNAYLEFFDSFDFNLFIYLIIY